MTMFKKRCVKCGRRIILATSNRGTMVPLDEGMVVYKVDEYGTMTRLPNAYTSHYAICEKPLELIEAMRQEGHIEEREDGDV